jgi:atypical dual specificity phosphatase
VLNTREACERLVAATTRAASSRACAIVDRVNAAPAARRGWLSAAFRPASAVVVHVATGAAAAASRAAGRVDHPTLAPTTAASVVRAVARSFVAPGAAEVAAGFSAVLVVDGDDGADEAVALLRARGRGRRRRPDPAAAAGAGAAVPAAATPPTRMEGIVKFPRTRHLLNLGGTGVTRDDLVLSRRDAEALVSLLRAQTTSTTLTVEEKVDGANVGFSLDADTGAIRAQNRSHYVDAGSHAQFRTLRAYINAKRAGLRRALSGGRVLYGEWMYARHSIRYTRLPSHFLAFDIWDAAAGRFLSRARFRAALAGSGIAMVPEVAVPRPATLDGLRAAAVGTASVLCDDGPVEGVVVRVDARDWMVERVKIVRPDFIVGNEHWSRAPLERNVIVGDGAAELYS